MLHYVLKISSVYPSFFGIPSNFRLITIRRLSYTSSPELVDYYQAFNLSTVFYLNEPSCYRENL